MNRGGPDESSTNRNMIIAIVLCLLFFIPYDLFVLQPMNKEVAKARAEAAKAAPAAPTPAPAQQASPAAAIAARNVVIDQDARIRFDAPSVDGTINLTGARIDDLSLKLHRQAVDPTSPEVVFLHPEATQGATYGVFGWTDHTGAVEVVGPQTRWTAPEGAVLTPQTPLTLTFDTGDGVVFSRVISVDEHYMFTVADRISNTSDTTRALRAYGAVRRHGVPADLVNYMTLHEGFTGVIGGELKELDYKPAARGKGQDAELLAAGKVSTGGWLGITDKYWLAAVVTDKDEPITGRYRAVPGPDGRTIFEAGFTGEVVELPAQGAITRTHRFFAGAKQATILKDYEEKLGVPDFDKAIDWGNFWFLTRPFFGLIDFFNKLVGNFGFAIMLTTIVVKAAMFPLVYQSYKAMSQMRLVQPKLQELQKRFAADKQRLQQEMAKLYQAEKINPVAGCMPILLQIPIFYSLYKVLLVTIEMRHAPFVGWINDLSAPDPTSWLNLFGLLPFAAPVDIPLLGFVIAVGAWPILYGVTMWGVTALSPQQMTDPIQKQIFGLMPIIFTFMFAAFPAGMVIYWTWSNFLSMVQQYVIMRRQGVETELDKWLARITGKKAEATPTP